MLLGEAESEKLVFSLILVLLAFGVQADLTIFVNYYLKQVWVTAHRTVLDVLLLPACG